MKLSGIGIGRGIATGPIRRMPDPLGEPTDSPRREDSATACASVVVALAIVAAELRERASAVDVPARDLLEAAALIAQDPTLIDDIRARIEAGATGERAVFEAFSAFQKNLVQLGGVWAERATDLGDVSHRIIARLRGVAMPGIPVSDEPFILVALDLAPAYTAVLDREKVAALITRDGGPTSHTAILAAAKSIPAVVGVTGALDLTDGTIVIVDAAAGTVVVDPSTDELAFARRRIAVNALSTSERLGGGAEFSRSSTAGTLADGTKIPLLANLGSAAEAADALALGAEGVGLFRTELLFLTASAAPTVEVQRAQYTELLTKFPGQRVVVRMFDSGADKPLAFLGGAREGNPALGLRGLRALRAKEDVLRDQLTALALSAAETAAELWVMAPMVADAEETEYFVALGRESGLKTVGVMAEVPSLALVADQALDVADFVSIGTNDLTQYTLAADRMLASVGHYQDPWHPAVLRLIKLIGDAGRARNKPVGVCGEAAADPQLAVVLVGLGVTTLSMTPAALSDVRSALAAHTLHGAQHLAALALRSPTARDAHAAGSGRA